MQALVFAFVLVWRLALAASSTLELVLGTTTQTNTLNAWFRNTAWTTLSAQMKVSLHTAVPDGTGSSEVTGGSYAQQNVTFNAPSSGAVAASATLTFSTMPAVTVAAVGVWCGSQFIQGAALTGGSQPVTAGNAFSLTSLSCSVS